VTAQQVIDSLNRARPVCVICRGESGHPPIVGDGPPRCYACIVRLVHEAASVPPPHHNTTYYTPEAKP
jgi:hypothetical protein